MEYFDEDDLINDYVDDFEPPPEYDDEMLQEMMGGDTSAAANAKPAEAATPTTPTLVPTSTEPEENRTSNYLSSNDRGEDVMNEEESPPRATEPTNVTEYISRQSRQHDIYKFERFNKQMEWRTKPMSPNNTMKAKAWKTKISLAASTPKSRQATAPEAQLLEFLQKREAASPRIFLTKKQAMSSPKEGVPSLPLTLGDGTRVYVRMRSESETNNTTTRNTPKSSCSTHSLGVSMKELIRRSDRIRKRTEHAKSKRATTESIINTTTPTTTSQKNNDDQLWVDKHAPSSFQHLLSDERTNREVLRALRAWDPFVFGRVPPSRPNMGGYSNNGNNNNSNQNQQKQPAAEQPSHDKRPDETNRVILLAGPPGVGKTTLAHIVARHAGYRPVEVNASDERSTSVLTERVRRAMESTTLNMSTKDRGRPNCLILDEIDGADAKGAIQSIVEIIRAEMPPKGQKGGKHATYLRRPIIFICNHKFAPALRPLLPYARHFNVNPPSATRLVARLKSVLNVEKLLMRQGSSLLHQLVVSSGGDIRSCLYTLQFAAAEAKDSQDISQALTSALGGEGMKDDRSDVAGTITNIFRKRKQKSLGGIMIGNGEDRASVTRVLDSVEAFGDNSQTLNALFMNILRVSYIDPTLDRCAAAHEWLSGADIYRSHKLSLHDQMAQYYMQRLHMPSAAAAVHLLCRVELKPDLTFSTRELSDIYYQSEANLGLVQKFADGIPPSARSTRCVQVLSTETIPFSLWILSAGDGSGSLNRAASSIEILTKPEKVSFDAHVAALGSLGLTYVVDREAHVQPDNNGALAEQVTTKVRLEPPIERLVQYVNLQVPSYCQRKEIPPAMKEILAHHVKITSLKRVGENKKTAPSEPTLFSKPNERTASPEKISQPKSEESPMLKARKVEDMALAAPTPKRMKTSSLSATVNFLGIGAQKAKEAKSARKAAQVGLELSKKIKMAHTGSGLQLNQVIRLKYVKGFTQAVRTPCRLEDLD